MITIASDDGCAKSVSVIVPVLNEGKNIGPTVNQLLAALSRGLADFEIIIIDDGSTDATAAEAQQLAELHPVVRVIHNQRNSGLGYSYARGCAAARKKFVVYVPGDNTWPEHSLSDLFSHIGEADVVTSYATNPEIRERGRRWVSAAYTWVLNHLFGYRLRYFNGLTIYPADFLRSEPATTVGFGFQAEVLLKALDAGLSYVEVPLSIDPRAAGRSKAVNVRNVSTVVATVLRLFWQLRMSSAPKIHSS